MGRRALYCSPEVNGPASMKYHHAVNQTELMTLMKMTGWRGRFVILSRSRGDVVTAGL